MTVEEAHELVEDFARRTAVEAMGMMGEFHRGDVLRSALDQRVRKRLELVVAEVSMLYGEVMAVNGRTDDDVRETLARLALAFHAGEEQ